MFNWYGKKCVNELWGDWMNFKVNDVINCKNNGVM